LFARWNRLYGPALVALRLGNVYGPRQMPHGEAGVVAIFMGLLRDGARRRSPATGSQSRDCVYVGDVVDAMLRALGRNGGVYNVVTGVETSIVRAVLLPATMKLLGDWNWYLPKHLGWLPKPDRQPGPALEPTR
jgi:nucleoside-diphosphate-sugar epimerase